MNRQHAHRPEAFRRTRRVAWWLLIAVLAALILLAWTAVPEPELMAWNR